jgi:hypothetical protein
MASMMRALRDRVTPSAGTRRWTGAGFILPGFLCAALAAADAAGQAFTLRRSVVATGGGASADATGSTRLQGTFAEPLTGGATLSSTDGRVFVATGGFWADARAPRDRFFVDQFETTAAAAAPTRE